MIVDRNLNYTLKQLRLGIYIDKENNWGGQKHSEALQYMKIN